MSMASTSNTYLLELERVFTQNRSVGASTATICRGALVSQNVFGLADAKIGIMVDATTRFQAASISKTVTR